MQARENFRQLAVTLLCQPDLTNQVVFETYDEVQAEGLKKMLPVLLQASSVENLAGYFHVVLQQAEIPEVIKWTPSGGPTNV